MTPAAHADSSSTTPPERNRYFVMAGNRGAWLIYREGTRQAVHSLPRKLLAVETAKTMAREDAPAEVMVEELDGMFKLTYSFGPDYAAH
jgi:hypothetical protein